MLSVKEKIINSVVYKASPLMDAESLQMFSSSLGALLYNYDIVPRETCTDIVPQDTDMRAYMMFFVAKKIEGLSPKSLMYYKGEINNFLGFLNNKPVKDITVDDIRYYLAVRSEKVSKVTLDNNRRVLSSFFSWLAAEEHIPKNPMLRIKGVRCERYVKNPFTEIEIEHLRDVCRNAREVAIIDLLLSTGMRVGEMASLQVKNIDLATSEIKVFGKGGKERICYLNAKAKKHLVDYMQSRADSPSLCVFVSETGGVAGSKAGKNPLSIGGIEKIVRDLGTRAGVDNVHPHRFRRTAATLALNRGMPIEQVQRMLGHEQMQTTLRYAVVAQENLKTSHGKYLG